MKKNFKSSSNPNKRERNFYKVWSEMNRRCRGATNKRNDKSYFEKGITVSLKWQQFDYFFIDMWSSYLSHLKKFGKDTELDRINNKKGYSKSNCRWVTRLENMNNTGNIRKIKGKTFTEWSRILKISSKTLIRRYESGLSIGEVLSPNMLKRGKKIITS